MSRLAAEDKIQPHWWGKTCIGLVLGLLLTYALVGIFAWFGPGGLHADVKVQFTMWIISPIWLSILAFTYLFKTARQALMVLSFATIVCYGVFFFLRWVI